MRQDPAVDPNYYHFNNNRVAAEWEPAKGVMFMCPPAIPKELIIEFARDAHIYPTVGSDEEQVTALNWFLDWGIDTSRVHFIKLPQVDFDITVPRDWGPPAIFSNDSQMRLADVVFQNSAPFTDLACNDSLALHRYPDTGEVYHSAVADTLIKPVAQQLGLEVLQVPIASTGGNVLVDGIGTALSTCILLTENRFNGVGDEEFFATSDALLGINNYHVTSNFDHYGIQHIDCLLKLIDEETLLVGQPPEDHDLFQVYENIVNNELSQLRNAYGKPYVIKRIKIGRIIEEYLSPYTNSLILNKTVYVPLYGIETDALALETWKSVLPGYAVKGFHFDIKDQPYKADWYFEGYLEEGDVPGWGPDDALHCRTRAIWDKDMIFISLNKVPSEISSSRPAALYASVMDYSGSGIPDDGVVLNWRVQGTMDWSSTNMTMAANQNNWHVEFPAFDEDTSLEYYVTVTTKEGDSQSRPMTAPDGYYQFKYGQ
ncbi:MAG: agmatine deiminase family protein [Cyclobacteriaceae bacterium]